MHWLSCPIHGRHRQWRGKNIEEKADREDVRGGDYKEENTVEEKAGREIGGGCSIQEERMVKITKG